MTKSLVTLIDNSLLPAALLIVGKFLGLLLIVSIFDISWSLNSIPGTFFSLKPLVYSQDIILVSTYSDIIMYISVMVGYSFVLVQALFFHNSHIDPKTLVRLASNNLMSLVQGSFDIYHKGAIWNIFLWLANFLILINVLSGKTSAWVFFVTTLVTLSLTIILLNDVHEEINLTKQQLKRNEISN